MVLDKLLSQSYLLGVVNMMFNLIEYPENVLTQPISLVSVNYPKIHRSCERMFVFIF